MNNNFTTIISVSVSQCYHAKKCFSRALWSRITKNPDVSRWPLGRLFIRSLALHRSLVRLLRPVLFARYSRSFACSLTSLTPLLVGKWMVRWLFILCFYRIWTIVPGRNLQKKVDKSPKGHPIYDHALSLPTPAFFFISEKRRR